MALVEVRNIGRQMAEGFSIQGISFEQRALEKIAIAGESGSGKTTLLKMISGHVQPDSGEVLFEGKRVKGPLEQLLPGHPKIGYLSQQYELLNNYRVEELVWFDNELGHDEAAALFNVCEVGHLLHRKTHQLSGGEKQRIALCMLLVKSPKLLVLDEPFSNLDLIHKHTLRNVLDAITEQLQITCILTSHDPHDTLSWADTILVMKQGSIVQQGTPESIYHQPVNEYVAGLFGRYTLLPPEQSAWFGIDNSGQPILLRPEQFTLSAPATNGIQGTIQKISFRGSHYEAEVLVQDLKLLARTHHKEWNAGDAVTVSVETNARV